MKCRISDLQDKEVVDISSGARYGCIGDLEIDTDAGTIEALVVCGRSRALGLLGREPDQTFHWSAIRRIGEDLILVEGTAPKPLNRRQSRSG